MNIKCINIKHPDFEQYFQDLDVKDKLELSAKMGVWMTENNTDTWPTYEQLEILPRNIEFIPLQQNRKLYEAFELTREDGSLKIFDKKDKKLLERLNKKSIYYQFHFVKTDPDEKYRILATEKKLKSLLTTNIRFKGKSISDVLNNIGQSEKEGLATVAKRLSKLNLKTKILVLNEKDYVVRVNKLNPNKDFTNTKGLYDQKSDTIFIKEDTDDATMLHEILHAATIDFLHNVPNQREWFKSYVDKVREKVGEEGKNYYGLTNELEFISEIMTNGAFIKFLDKFPPIYNNKTKSIWQELKSIITNWLGLSDSVSKEGINAVSELLDTIENTFVKDINYYNYDYRLMEQEFKYDEDSIKYSKELIKEGIDFVFEQNPELANIGNEEQYSQYLDTIFPDSKVKDIVYHGSKNQFDKFDKKFIGRNVTGETDSFSFSSSRVVGETYRDSFSTGENTNELAERYYSDNADVLFKEKDNFNQSSKILLSGIKSLYPNLSNEEALRKQQDYQEEFERLFDAPKLYSIILNINNPIIKDAEGVKKRDLPEDIKRVFDIKDVDGRIIKNINDWGLGDLYQVFEPEQIHILGSNQDVEGFKNFVGKKELSNYKSENPLKSYDSPDLIASMSNLLQDKFNVKINFIHDSELNNFSDVPEINKARAFVKNGEYYINIDKASIAEPLHELLHMVLASMKYSDFDNYMRLVESVENHPLYNDIIQNYEEINSDVLEETFITLFTETVRKNILASGVFTEDSFEESVKNAITQMFDLGVSLNRNSTYELMDMNVKDILFDFSSNLLENRNEIYNTDNAVKMMALSSLYRKLLKDGDLIQKCNG